MKKEVPPAYALPRPDNAVTSAIQALHRGEASADQQKRALKWIIEEAASTYDMPYRPGEDGRRDTDFACGRMFVGSLIVKEIKINLMKIKENKND